MKLIIHSNPDIINKLRSIRRIFLLAGPVLLISMEGFGQLIAGFSASSTNICSGSTVTFADNSTVMSESTIYNWDFGVGASPAIATGIGPHIVEYTVPGTGTVSLTITDGVYEPSTKTDYITIIALPSVPEVAVTDNCDGTSTLSTTAEGILLWSTAETSSSITVSTADIYTVTTTIDGCMSLPGSGIAAPKTIPSTPVVTVVDNCDGTSTLSTIAEGTLLWSTMEMSSSIIVGTPGIYSVSTTVTGCTSLTGSGTAAPKISPLLPIESVDCSLGFKKAVINISSPLGAGYEYRLDGGEYQSEAFFAGVNNGSHIITVRNTDGCTTIGNFFEVSCGCVNGATVTLSSQSGNICGKTPITISGNSFGGVADWVTITENGDGSVSPSLSFTSPFTFTYTPKSGDEGKTVIITVTTNNPLGTPCVAAKETYTLTVNANPSAPESGIITQPSCSSQTAGIVLNGLPAAGTWTLTRAPEGITTPGSGNSTTILNLFSGTYNYTVTNEAGCISESSANIIIEAQPITPLPPQIGTITHPTCSVSTGTALVDGLPATGEWTLTRSPGGVRTTGSGTSTLIKDLPAGTYTFKVINPAGCTSLASAGLIINSQPLNPAPPVVGIIIPPTCILSTGSVELSGLASTGTWILTRYPGTVILTGSGTSITIPDLSAGVYNFTLTNATGCISVPSANVIIPVQPSTPSPPAIGTIILPTCTLASGSVVLNGLPASGSWKLTRSPDAITITGTGINKTITGLTVGNYTFTVTNAAGCNSASTSIVAIARQPDIPSVRITNPSTVCSPSKVDLTAENITFGSTPGLSFTYWTNIDATIPYLTPAATEEGTFYIKGTTTAGCFDIKPVTVTADILPTADAGPDQVLEYQFTTTLDADLANDFETGVWSVISGTGEFEDKTYAKTPVNGLSSDKNEFLWTVTRGICPDAYDTVMITIHDLKTRTLITPNMDGSNDYFVIKGLNTLGKTELIVFDRRGVQVYKNGNYDNLWNGIDNKGNQLQDDTYFYILKTESDRTVKGFIVIRR